MCQYVSRFLGKCDKKIVKKKLFMQASQGDLKPLAPDAHESVSLAVCSREEETGEVDRGKETERG